MKDSRILISIVICLIAILLSCTKLFEIPTKVWYGMITLLVITALILKSMPRNKKPTSTPKRAILGLGGSFNPIHKQHIELLNKIKQHFERNENINIIGAFLVLSTDDYVYNKLSNEAIKHSHRIELCELSIKDSGYDQWLFPSHYASVSSSSYMRDIKTNGCSKIGLEKNDSKSDDEVMIIQCMGADKEYIIAEMNKSVNNKDMDKHICVIGRKGSCLDLKQEIEKNEFGEKSECGTYLKVGDKFTYLDMELENVSSTAVRKHIKELELSHSVRSDEHVELFRSSCKDMLHPSAIQYVVDNVDEIFMD